MSPRLINEIDEANVSETTSQQTLVRPPSRTESKKRRRKPKHALTRATGPRTPEGKQRSRYNAATHGIFAVGVLPRESKEEYHRLVNELAESLQPVGRLEELLVEKLAMLSWRYRRLLEAEAAEITNVVTTVENPDYTAEAFRSLTPVENYGLISSSRLTDNLVGLSTAIDLLKKLRQKIKEEGLDWERDRDTLARLCGVQDEETGPQPAGPIADKYRELAKSSESKLKQKGSATTPVDLTKPLLEMIDEQIKLSEPEYNERILRRIDHRELEATAALVPRPDVAERLQRYEGSLERAFDRTLAQLERLQRLRLGQPVAPPLNVHLSA